MLISGYAVVRKPIWYWDFLCRVPPIKPCNQVPIYSGINRFIWFDFDDAYYDYDGFLENDYDIVNLLLSDELDVVHLLKNIDNMERLWPAVFGIRVIQRVCECSNQYAKKRYADYIGTNNINEIIGVYSPYLHENFSSINSNDNFQFLGYDVVLMGSVSLILYGLFDCLIGAHYTKNNTDKILHSAKWYPKINKNGLFDSIEEAQCYATDYKKDEQENSVEPFWEGSCDFQAIYRCCSCSINCLC